MARICLCDWEMGTLLGNFMIEDTSVTNISYQSAVVRSGAYACRVNPVGAALGWNSYGKQGDPAIDTSSLTNRSYTSFGVAPTSIWIRTYFQWLTKPAANDEQILSVTFNGTNSTIALLLRSDGALQLIDSTGASLGVGATILASGTWYRIELNANKGVAAAYELRIDGVTELSGIANQTALDMFTVIIGKRINRNSQTIDVYYDDFVVDDATWPGPGAVLNLRPDANGTFTAWASGTGASDFTQVDEIPTDGDTSYIANNGLGAVEVPSTFNYQSCASVGIFGGIKAVQPWCDWRTIAVNMQAFFRLISGATTVNSAVTRVLTVYRKGYNIYTLDPNTGLAWTVAGVNAVQHGVVIPAPNAGTIYRATGLGLFVDFDDTILGGTSLLACLGAGK